MGRETDDEREARLKQAGVWLESALGERDLSQKQVAERLGVAPQQVSAYVRGRYEIDADLARDLAVLLKLPERDVWRGMRLRLPAEFESDEALDAYYEAKYPGVFRRVLGEEYGGNPGHTPIRRPNVTRESEAEARSQQERASGT